MKRIGLLGLGLLFTLCSLAQQTVNSQNILGKWVLYSVKQDGVFEFEIQSKKVTFDTTFAKSIKENATIREEDLADTLRASLTSLSDMGFEFFPNGKSMTYKGGNNQEEGTYEIDEKQGILTSYGSETGSKEVIAVKLVAGLLEMILIEPETEGVVMRFAKQK